ncbi:MAG: Dabb family protein [Paraglaciecola chathamensis]|nr:Stress responsive alpha-beta barrel domain-containing protein [Glaciecola sp. 4H-3-7+YE-5]
MRQIKKTSAVTRMIFNAGLAIGLLLATALPINAQTNSDAMATPTVIHSVFFWLKNPDSVDDRKSLIEGLNSLRDIPQIQALHVGVPASTVSRDVIDSSYQVSELMFFNSVKDQDEYQSHPIHKQFVKDYAHLWHKVVVYDSLNTQ